MMKFTIERGHLEQSKVEMKHPKYHIKSKLCGSTEIKIDLSKRKKVKYPSSLARKTLKNLRLPTKHIRSRHCEPYRRKVSINNDSNKSVC